MPLQGGVLLPEGSPRFGVWVLASLQVVAGCCCQSAGCVGALGVGAAAGVLRALWSLVAGAAAGFR